MLHVGLTNMKRASVLLALFAFNAVGQTHIIEDATLVSQTNSVVAPLTIKGSGSYYIYINDRVIRNNEGLPYDFIVIDKLTVNLRLKNLTKKTKSYSLCSRKVDNNIVMPFRLCSIQKARRI